MGTRGTKRQCHCRATGFTVRPDHKQATTQADSLCRGAFSSRACNISLPPPNQEVLCKKSRRQKQSASERKPARLRKGYKGLQLGTVVQFGSGLGSFLPKNIIKVSKLQHHSPPHPTPTPKKVKCQNKRRRSRAHIHKHTDQFVPHGPGPDLGWQILLAKWTAEKVSIARDSKGEEPRSRRPHPGPRSPVAQLHQSGQVPLAPPALLSVTRREPSGPGCRAEGHWAKTGPRVLSFRPGPHSPKPAGRGGPSGAGGSPCTGAGLDRKSRLTGAPAGPSPPRAASLPVSAAPSRRQRSWPPRHVPAGPEARRLPAAPARCSGPPHPGGEWRSGPSRRTGHWEDPSPEAAGSRLWA